jgi:serine/threonine-protein kinase RsbW
VVNTLTAWGWSEVVCRRPGACWGEPVPDGGGVAPWHQEVVRSPADVGRALDAITAAVAGAGHTRKDAFAVRLALEEAIVNAHKHGHREDWGVPIAVRYWVGAGVVAQVEDQGPGFDPGQVPDPTAPENLERSTGRGLLLMRAYMTLVCHSRRGNCVCLCRDRPLAAPGAPVPPGGRP